MPGPYPNSDEEDLARNAGSQARGLARRAFKALSSPCRSRRSNPSSTSPSASWKLPSHTHAPDEMPSQQDQTPDPDPRPVSPKSPLQENTPLSPAYPDPEDTPLVPPTREGTPLSPKTMSNSANAPVKGGKRNVNIEADSIMPLLFATIGNPTINFKKMAAMDEEGRTESSLEHRFRKWRQLGREIAEKHPEHAAPVKDAGPKKGRPAKKNTNGKGKSKQADVGNEEDDVDDDEEAGDVKVKHEQTDDEAESEKSPPTVKGKGKAKKAAPTNATKNGENVNTPKETKKRGSEDMTADADNEETPAKKTKKGTAKVVKKTAVKDQDEEHDGPADEATGKGKGKGKAKAKPKAKAAPKMKDVTEEEPGVAALHDANDLQLDDHVFDPELLGETEEMTEMKFEEEI